MGRQDVGIDRPAAARAADDRRLAASRLSRRRRRRSASRTTWTTRLQAAAAPPATTKRSSSAARRFIAQALPLADRLYLTRVLRRGRRRHALSRPFDWDDWRRSESKRTRPTTRTIIRFTYSNVYERVNRMIARATTWPELSTLRLGPRGDELMIAYHDEEWGVPVHDDRKQFEFLTLESAQAGLSWADRAARSAKTTAGRSPISIPRKSPASPQSGSRSCSPTRASSAIDSR